MISQVNKDMDFYQDIVQAVEKKSHKRRNRKRKKSFTEVSTPEGDDNMEAKVEKTKEQILAERKAKKAAKKQGVKPTPVQQVDTLVPQQVDKVTEKMENLTVTAQRTVVPKEPAAESSAPVAPSKTEKSREEILKERELKKLMKQKGKQSKKEEQPVVPVDLHVTVSQASTISGTADLSLLKDGEILFDVNGVKQEESTEPTVTENKSSVETAPKKSTTRAERKAIQEAQRAKKAAEKAEKEKATVKKSDPAVQSNKARLEAEKSTKSVKVTSETQKKVSANPTQAKESVSTTHRVKLFDHLYTDKRDLNIPVNSKIIHPAIIRLGIQYANGIIVGGNARCVAFLKAMQELIVDYITPEKKDFSRGLEALLTPAMDYLNMCRASAVSMTNALRYIKYQISLLKTEDNDKINKEYLLDAIDTYIRDQIDKAAMAICDSMQQMLLDGDVILTYGCSSLVQNVIETANNRKVDFRVIIVDSLPRREGQQLLKRLTASGIHCTCVLINAVSFVIPEVTKVLLGAHALLANGDVVSRVGTAQVALIAKTANVPVFVCCETHKFTERVQTDAFVYNEIGNPDDLVSDGVSSDGVKDPLAKWETSAYLTPLNLSYDLTPKKLVTTVVTEIGPVPSTSVPLMLRSKTTEIGY